MAKKKLVRKDAGYGNVPGYGKVSTPDPTTSAWGGHARNSIQAGFQNATPPTFTPQAPPPDPTAGYRAQFEGLLGDARNNAGRGYNNFVANSIGDEGTAALDYGATLAARDPNADPSTATGYSFDWNNVESNNPFSKAGLLVRSYKQQQNRTTNGLAAQGQLYSGAYQNQQAADNFGYQQEQDSLLKGLQAYLVSQARARGQAGIARDDAITQAGLSGLGSLLGN